MKPKFFNGIRINKYVIINSILTCFLALVSMHAFSQTSSVKGMNDKGVVKVESLSITVTVDSAEELESTLKLNDLKDILKKSDANQALSFEIICNKANTLEGLKSHISYKFEGNTNQTEEFLKYAERIRLAALNYYNEK